MKVLVTGANGHIGCNLLRALLARGHEPAPLVRVGADTSGIAALGLELRYGDILDAASLREAARGCDAVINLAAVYSMRARDPEDVMRPALDGVRNVLETARALGIGRVVHTSSAAALGLSRTAAELRSEASWNDHPKSPYYAAKTESERCAWTLSHELEVPLVVLCPTVVLGQYDMRITPSTFYIQQLVERRAQTSHGGLNLVDVRDVARAHVEALERGSPGERYVVGGDNVTSKRIGALLGELTGRAPAHLGVPRFVALATVPLLELAQRAMGAEPAITGAEARELAGLFLFVNTSKARDQLGLRNRGAREVLDQCVRWLVFRGALGPKTLARLAPRFEPDPDWVAAVQP